MLRPLSRQMRSKLIWHSVRCKSPPNHTYTATHQTCALSWIILLGQFTFQPGLTRLGNLISKPGLVQSILQILHQLDFHYHFSKSRVIDWVIEWTNIIPIQSDGHLFKLKCICWVNTEYLKILNDKLSRRSIWSGLAQPIHISAWPDLACWFFNSVHMTELISRPHQASPHAHVWHTFENCCRCTFYGPDALPAATQVIASMNWNKWGTIDISCKKIT